MYYYKAINECGELVFLLTYSIKPNITNPLVTEITPEEYEVLSAELRAKAEPAEPETTTEQE